MQCVDISNGGMVVNDGFCISSSESNSLRSRSRRRRRRRRKSGSNRRTRKPKTTKVCNRLPCPFKWEPGQWSEVREHDRLGSTVLLG